MAESNESSKQARKKAASKGTLPSKRRSTVQRSKEKYFSECYAGLLCVRGTNPLLLKEQVALRFQGTSWMTDMRPLQWRRDLTSPSIAHHR